MNKLLSACLILSGFLFWQPVSADEGGLTVKELLKQASIYQGKVVRVSGVLHCRFEDAGLYASKEDSDKNNYAQALWVVYAREGFKIKPLVPEKNMRLQELDGQLVEMEGEFCQELHGHFGVYAAGLKDVRLARQLKELPSKESQ